MKEKTINHYPQHCRVGKSFPRWQCDFDKTGKACGNTDAGSFVDLCSICGETI
jgi:hypothetical protein